MLDCGASDVNVAQGWVVRCEKGGIRRVLMNIFGNSLKFTSVRSWVLFACTHYDLTVCVLYRMDIYM